MNGESENGGTPRRRFLQGGLVAAALLGSGGVWSWSRSGYVVSGERSARLLALSEKELAIVDAVVSRMMRPDAADPPTPEELDCGLRIDGLVAKLDADTRDELRKLLHVVEHVLPLRTGRATRFTKLDGAAQDAVLGAMMVSEVPLLRGAFDSLKSLCAMSYFQDARTWGAIGYDGPLVNRPQGGWVEAARLGRAR